MSTVISETTRNGCPPQILWVMDTAYRMSYVDIAISGQHNNLYCVSAIVKILRYVN